MKHLVALLAGAAAVSAQSPTREQALAFMKKSAEFYATRVSTGGGYHFTYAEDLSYGRSEHGEGPTQVEFQREGTPIVGMAFLEAFDATGDKFYLEAARAAAHALVKGQLCSGGWDYFVEFDPDLVRTQGTHVMAWTRITFTVPQGGADTNARRYQSQLQLHAIDCAAAASTLVGVVTFSGALGLGGLARFFSFQADPPPPKEFDIGPAANYPQGSVTVLLQIPATLRHTSKGFMKRIVDQFNLQKLLASPDLKHKLAQAGLRGQAPLVTFLFFRMIMPFVLAAGAILLGPLPVFLRLLGLMPANGHPALLRLLITHATVMVTAVIVIGILLASMVADVIDENELATGKRQEGMFSSAIAFTMKFGPLPM